MTSTCAKTHPSSADSWNTPYMYMLSTLCERYNIHTTYLQN